MIQIFASEKQAFGWSVKAWSYVLFQLIAKADIQHKNDEKLKVLEVGATQKAIVASIFKDVNAEIDISCYLEGDLEGLNQQADVLNNGPAFFKAMQADVFCLESKYDIIVLKSVLGGLHRGSKGRIDEINDLVSKLISENLLPNGCLITLDNGYSYAERILKRFGARKNNWTFFKLGQIQADDQIGFGVLSCFSFQTRLGLIGFLIDEFVTFPIDLILSKIMHKRPTVIGSIVRTSTVERE